MSRYGGNYGGGKGKGQGKFSTIKEESLGRSWEGSVIGDGVVGYGLDKSMGLEGGVGGSRGGTGGGGRGLGWPVVVLKKR
jgi:hypothetical protein